MNDKEFKLDLLNKYLHRLVGKDNIDRWMSHYNDHLKAIPNDLIKTEDGYKQVKDYLAFWVYN